MPPHTSAAHLQLPSLYLRCTHPRREVHHLGHGTPQALRLRGRLRQLPAQLLICVLQGSITLRSGLPLSTALG